MIALAKLTRDIKFKLCTGHTSLNVTGHTLRVSFFNGTIIKNKIARWMQIS